MDTYVCTDIYTNTCIHTIHTDTKHTVSIAHTCNTVHTHTHTKLNTKTTLTLSLHMYMSPACIYQHTC